MNTHHCSHCNRDIIPDELEDEFGPTGNLRCPHCGAFGNASEYGVDVNFEWVKPLCAST